MSKPSKESLSAMLHGRERGEEVDANVLEVLRQNDQLLLVLGYDDGGMGWVVGHNHDSEFEPGKIIIDELGLRTQWPEAQKEEESARQYFLREKLPRCQIEAKFDGHWTFATKTVHSTFDILCDGDLFCRGIVLDLSEVDMLVFNPMESVKVTK